MKSPERTLYVVFTMDCLPARPRGPVDGPSSWDDAEGAMMDFASALDEHGVTGTFFVVPEALTDLDGAVKDLQEDGFEAGLLCHPPISGYKSWFGAYPYETQREIARVARSSWEQKLGEEVDTIRTGYFSGDDYTFQVLCMEGFKQGSCSLPGKVNEKHSCMWKGSYPLARHTDPLDRKLKGTMEFYEVPVTSDFDAESGNTTSEFTPPHLSLSDSSGADAVPELVRKNLRRMDEEQPDARTLTFHADNLSRGPAGDAGYTELVGRVLECVRAEAGEHDLEVESATIADIHRLADDAGGSAGPV